MGKHRRSFDNLLETRSHLTLPQSTLLYSRYGNGIATNNLSKMLAGLMLPERPIGNMYFAAWSHNVIANAVNLCNDLKMGEYRTYCRNRLLAEVSSLTSHPVSSQDPPRVMFLTQVYGYDIGRLHQLRRHDQHCQRQP